MLFIVAFVLLFIPGSTESSDLNQQVLSLPAVIERSLRTHPEILASEKGLQQASGLLRQAGVRPNPEVQADFGTSSVLGDSGDQEWSIAYVQPFELGNKRKKRLTIAEFSMLIAQQQILEQKRQLILEIKKSFAEMLGNQALLEATTRSVELQSKLNEFTAEKVKQGEAASVEQDLSEIELNRLELEKTKTAAELASAISTLKLTAGLNELETIQGSFTENLPSKSFQLADLITAAKEKNPTLQIANLEYRHEEASVSLTKAQSVSDLHVFVQYTNEKSRFDAFGTNGSGMTIPLKDSDQIVTTGISFNLPFSRNQGNISAAVARAEQARLKAALLEKATELQVANGFRRYEVAKEAYNAYKNSIIPRSDKQIEIMRISFESGELRFLDWMNELKRTFEIQKDFILAAKEYFLASAEIEFLTGTDLNSEEGL